METFASRDSADLRVRLLLLGGTTEASLLARALAERDDIVPLLSLAGRTVHPATAPILHRTGGFGGVAGLTTFLQSKAIQAVVDATHPFAPRISAHAAEACGTMGVPLATFTRPAWSRRSGDRWTSVDSLEAAADALGPESRRVLLTTGRLGLKAFKAAPQHSYLIRTIDPPDPADYPPNHRVVLGRGPFAIADEIGLMRRERIDVLVTKNSGGDAGLGKIEAARALGLPVVVVERAAGLPSGAFTRLADVLAWIDAQLPGAHDCDPP